jgi:RimK family alpha-L-glutamate ligase
MRKLVALVSGMGWHVQDLTRAARALGVEFEAVPFPRVVGRLGGGWERIEAGGIDLTRVGGVLVRMMPPGTLEQVVFRMDALQRLQAMGIRVLNPARAVEMAVDKYLALATMAGVGLPVPPTWSCESSSGAMEAFEALGGDVVVKPLFGSEGRGLIRVSHPELARRTFRALERLGSVLYVQQAVRHPGHDLRVFVLDDRVVGAIRRHAPAGDWRTNVALGGRPEPFTPDAEVERLALRSARAVGARMAGVDLLLDLDRGALVVLEVNAVPGWRALARSTGIDVAAEILRAFGPA